MEEFLVRAICALMFLTGSEGLEGELLVREPGSLLPYAVECKSCRRPEEEKYEGSLGLCCSKCPPGSYKSEPCTRERDTQCRWCQPGLYAESWDIVGKCFSCRGLCRADMGLVELQACTPRTMRRCGCKPGTFCKPGVDESDSTCNDCAPHRSCPPGEGVSVPGNHSKDTVCERCRAGTFSNISSRTWRCRSHTNCSLSGLNAGKQGNATTDTECVHSQAGLKRQEGDRNTDSTSVSLAILSAILFLIVVATTICLLQGHGKEQPFQLSCFKTVFKTCIGDAEAQTAEENSREGVSPDELLFPSGDHLRQAPSADRDPVTLECDSLRGRASGPSPSPNGGQSGEAFDSSHRDPPMTTNRQPETDGEVGANSTGIVGPLFIYNPSRVYVGVISPQRGWEREKDPREGTGREGSLRYPQQEAGTQEGESGHLPEQEWGKESHLSESVSQRS